MKKNIILCLVLIMCTVVSYAAVFEIENDTEKFLVTMINQEPDPVSPGNLLEVRFRIENKQTKPENNVEVKIEPKYPFALYGSEEKIKQIGTLAAGQTGDTGVRVKYTLSVDKDATEGNNDLEFWYRINEGGWQKAGDFTVDIRDRDAVLAINEIKASNNKMLPGTKSGVSFKLENMATSVLKDIKLKLELFTSATGTTTELPFTPMGSSNEKTIALINPGKSEEIPFELFIDAEADSKVYKVPYVLTYSDEVGSNFSRSGYVGIMIDAEPDVSINIDETNIYSSGSKGSISIKFVNKGFSDVKFLDVVLKETDKFEILSNPEVYIGNIDSDDYESADYDLLIKEGIEGPVELPLKVEYRNSNGKMYSEDVSLKLSIYTGDALKQRANVGGNSSVGILIIIVIVVSGILVWRWRKKKKAKSN